MIKELLHIRFIQFSRELQKLGAFYTILGSIAFIVVLSLLNQYLIREDTSPYVVSLYGFLLFSLHFARTDHQFLQLLFPNTFRVYIIEYVVASLPILILLIAAMNWLFLTLFLGGICLMALIKPKYRKPKPIRLIIKHLPASVFEWIAGLRSVFWLFLLLYGVALVTVPLRFVSLLVFWVLTSLIFSFYRIGEPSQLLEAEELPPKQFLAWKMKKHLQLFFVISLPISLLYTAFNPSHWWIVLVFEVLLCMNLLVSIVSKYAHYEPNQVISVNDFTNSLLLMSVLIPFMLPIPLILGLRNYRKAIQQLNNYLDAYH